MPCTWAIKTAVFTVHGRVRARVRAAYTAVIGSWTDHVHGPCTAVYTVCTRPWAAVYTGRKHGRVGVPCTRPWTHYVHGRCTPVYTVRARRERPCTRPYTRYVHRRAHGRKHGRVHGHGRAMYMARARPCTQSVHGRGRPCTDCGRPPSAVYKLCTRPYTCHAHGPSVSRTRPCTEPVRSKTRPGTRPVPDRVRTIYMAVHGPCTVYTAGYTAVFTARVHGRVRTMYTAVHGPSVTRTRPCTRSCTLYTAVFTARVRGRVPCTCTCLWPVYTAVLGRACTLNKL